MPADAFELRRIVQQHFLGRISSVMFDPGYRNHLALIADGYDVSVFLDDKLQDDCITADPMRASSSGAHFSDRQGSPTCAAAPCRSG